MDKEDRQRSETNSRIARCSRIWGNELETLSSLCPSHPLLPAQQIIHITGRSCSWKSTLFREHVLDGSHHPYVWVDGVEHAHIGGGAAALYRHVLRSLARSLLGEEFLNVSESASRKRRRTRSLTALVHSVSNTTFTWNVTEVSEFCDELETLLTMNDATKSKNVFIILEDAERLRYVDDSFFVSICNLQESVSDRIGIVIISDLPSHRFEFPFLSRSFKSVHFSPPEKNRLVEYLCDTPLEDILDSKVLSSVARDSLITVRTAFASFVLKLLSVLTLDVFMLERYITDLLPRLLAPVVQGKLGVDQLPSLFRAVLPHIKKLLDGHEGVIDIIPGHSSSSELEPPQQNGCAPNVKSSDLSHIWNALPRTAAMLLVSSYLASHFPSKSDLSLFTCLKGSRRQGTSKDATNWGSDSAHPFPLERLLAIFSSIACDEGEFSAPVAADVFWHLNSLILLRLIVLANRSVSNSEGASASSRTSSSKQSSYFEAPLNALGLRSGERSIILRCDVPLATILKLASSWNIDLERFDLPRL